MIQTVTIDHLRPGHEYPGGGINSRRDYTKDQVKDRLESIVTFGVLQSLCVCPAPGESGPPFYVAAGGLRMAAIAKGIADKRLPADFAIPINPRADFDGAMALAASLEENDQVLAPHPVTTYEQFDELVKRGKTEQDLAKLFRMELKEVRRILALGRLSPIIRKAWLDEEIDADDAKVFTLAKDQKHQEDVFRRLKKTGGLHAWRIKEALIGNRGDAGKFLKFVGREAYEAAGGKIQEDLFSERESEKLIPTDHALLIRVAGEKIEAKCVELREAGWSWAEDEDDLPNRAEWNWNKIPTPSANASKELKAKSGCSLTIDHDGKLKITYGLLKPGTRVGKIDDPKAKGKGVPPPSNKISNSLKQRLESWAARATQDALKADTYGDAVAITLASIVAALIQPDRLNYSPQTVVKKLAEIRDGLTPKMMSEALRKRFDAENYFKSAPKGLVIRAIAEAVSDEQAKKLASGTKVAAWKFALANVAKTNWLPPELRTAHYDGPATKKITTRKAKKTAAAKPKRKAA